jgi:hypothetical protein
MGVLAFCNLLTTPPERGSHQVNVTLHSAFEAEAFVVCCCSPKNQHSQFLHLPT